LLPAGGPRDPAAIGRREKNEIIRLVTNKATKAGEEMKSKAVSSRVAAASSGRHGRAPLLLLLASALPAVSSETHLSFSYLSARRRAFLSSRQCRDRLLSNRLSRIAFSWMTPNNSRRAAHACSSPQYRSIAHCTNGSLGPATRRHAARQGFRGEGTRWRRPGARVMLWFSYGRTPKHPLIAP
jgi:hypothetical protein